MLRFTRQHIKETAIILAIVIFIGTLWFLGYKRHIRDTINQAYNVTPISAIQLQLASSSKADKLMIVAHPDDEVLWGGGHLYDKGYLVVCVTNGRNKVRSQEFKDVVTASGNECIMLEYPDKVRGKRDDWALVKDGIESDLEKIMTCKDWKLIAVHNQKGEYGHIHHVNVHNYVTEIYDKNDIQCDLYCFGKYYKASRLKVVGNTLPKISKERYEFKKKLADMYTSQKKTVDKLWHMAYYEDWTLYKRYSEHPEMKKQTATALGVAVNEAQ